MILSNDIHNKMLCLKTEDRLTERRQWSNGVEERGEALNINKEMV